MQSAELRELTASEELTLEQEYAMQRESCLFPGQTCSPDVLRMSIGSWQEDEDSSCPSSNFSPSHWHHFLYMSFSYC
jgi:hypothetical protein